MDKKQVLAKNDGTMRVVLDPRIGAGQVQEVLREFIANGKLALMVKEAF